MFRLLIECSRDIERISIDFTDGSTVVRERREQNGTGVTDKPLDTSGFAGTSTPVSKEVVSLPDIPVDTREPAVADELHNLDF